MNQYRVVRLLVLLLLTVPLAGLQVAAQQAQQSPTANPGVPDSLYESKQYQRWIWAVGQRAYPLGRIPAGAREQALQQTRAQDAAQAQVAGGLRPPPKLWSNIGPEPINNGQIGATLTSRNVSGRVGAVAVDPGDSDRWLIGGAQGGIWETLDGGDTWKPLTDDLDSLAMGAIAFAPSDPDIVYAGTGEAAFSGDAYAGAGLFKSTDGGHNWTLVNTTSFAGAAVSKIVVDPADPDILLAATTTGIAGRGGFFPPSMPARGILRSTNGGTTFNLILTGEATDIVVDPSDFDNQYAFIGSIFGGGANGLYRSSTAGASFSLISGPWSGDSVGRGELAFAPSDSSTLYVSIHDAFDSVGNDGGLLGLFVSSDALVVVPTFTQISTTATDNGTGIFGYCGWDNAFGSGSNQCWYDHEIIVDPSDPDVLYAGGIPLWKLDNSSGASWSEVSMTDSSPNDGIHVDQHAMAWSGTRLIVGNDGGVWSTTDGGLSWNEHNNGLSITQFYFGAVDPSDPRIALGGSQDNGTSRRTLGNNWELETGGDGADNIISTTDPSNDWATSFQGLIVLRTVNGGASYSGVSGIDTTGASFIAPFEMCPGDPDVVVAGANNAFRSDNFFSGGTATFSSNGPELGSSITAIGFAPSDATCDTYALGTSNGQLWVTDDGGSTWNHMDGSGAVPNRWVTDVVFDPDTSSTMLASLSGFGTGHLFRTTDALAGTPGWTDVSTPVNLPHNAVAVSPSDPDTWYVGTDLGVWLTRDAGATWTHHGPALGMPNVAVFDLQITPKNVVAFTHGRGAFQLAATFGVFKADDE